VTDCLRTPFGRRRPLIALAAVGIVGATSAQWFAAIRLNLSLFAAAVFAHMLGWTMLYAANSGLVLDSLPAHQLPLASSCAAVHVAVGAVLAFGTAALTPRNIHYHYQYGIMMLFTASVTFAAMFTPEKQMKPHEPDSEWFRRCYSLDFVKERNFSLMMMGKVLMYGGGVAKGYLIYFLRDTWDVTDLPTLHVKVATVAISAEVCACITALCCMWAAKREQSQSCVLSPQMAAIVGACTIGCSWAVMIPIGFLSWGYDTLEIFAVMYGLGHGFVLYGDVALTFLTVPAKANGSRSFGLQSVAAFIGMSLFAFLASLVVDTFGRLVPYTLPGPRAGPLPIDGHRLEGYVALFVFVALANFCWAGLFSMIKAPVSKSASAV